MDKMTDIESIVQDEYQRLWSDPKGINRNDKKQVLGWHLGYYEKGFRSYKKSIVNMNNYVGKLLDINENNFRILDAGCGVGATLTQLAKKNPNSAFYCITLSSNEVILAEELKRRNNLKNTNFYQKSYNRTDFPDEYFDRIYALESAVYAQDYKIFIKEMYKILKKDGKLVVVDMFGNNDLTDPFSKNIRHKIVKEKNYNKARHTIGLFERFLIEEGFENKIILDLIKSRNVKFSQLYFFLFQYLFWTYHRNTMNKIKQKSYKPLFFRWRFIYFFLFKYLLILLTKPSYYSIIVVKK